MRYAASYSRNHPWPLEVTTSLPGEDNRRDERPNHSSGMTKGAPYVLSVESLATFNVTAHDDVPTGRVFLLLGHCRAGDRRG